MKERSLARFVYETRRSIEGRVRQVEKRRGQHGHIKSDYPRTSTRVRRTEKGDKGSGQRGRRSGEISEQSLIEEIEGSGILGPAEGADIRERARKRLEELGRIGSLGLSGLGGRIASKREAAKGR